MPAAHRHRTADLRRRLLEAPQAFEFFQAVRILGHALATEAGNGVGRIRYRTCTSLTHPVGDITSIRVLREDKPIVDIDEAVAALSDPAVEVEVTQAFMGLLGVHGTLPLGYTELFALGEGSRRDNAAGAFLDALCQRPMARYVDAWRYQHPALGYEDTGESGLERAMKALSGRIPVESEPAAGSGGPVTDDHMARVCAAMRQHPMSAPYLGQVLSACLRVPVRVKDGVGAWYDIPDEMQARLGGPHAVLGQGAVMGTRMWQRHLRLQLHIGPMRLDRYDTFFANGEGLTALRQWLAALVGNTYEYEIILILHKDDVRTGRLGQSRLGRDAFIGTTLGHEHRSDARFMLSLTCLRS